MTTHREPLSPIGPCLLVLPVGWRELRPLPGTRCWERRGLRVITSRCRELDGQVWLHVSCSRAEALPSWDDLADVRRVFTPLDRTALQVLPPPAKYVNHHPHCLHLWVCMDGDVTPDFAAEGTI